MRTKTVKFIYGDTSERDCQVCWKKRTRFGFLVDPNGHTWNICAECITTLWNGNQALITSEEIERRARELLQERLIGE